MVAAHPLGYLGLSYCLLEVSGSHVAGRGIRLRWTHAVAEAQDVYPGYQSGYLLKLDSGLLNKVVWGEGSCPLLKLSPPETLGAQHARETNPQSGPGRFCAKTELVQRVLLQLQALTTDLIGLDHGEY